MATVDFRILDTNRVLTATLTPSSEDSEFPASNLQLYSRARTWRASGYFVITSSNNKLNFDEGGSELTATITAATYTPTTLAAEIKTQMDGAGGAGTYTVTFSTSTGKWTLASDQATFNLLWNTGTDTANTIGDTIGFDTSADDTGAVTYTGDNIALHTEEFLVVDLGSALAVDSVALMFNPIDGITTSSTATIKIQANASNSWGSPSVDVTLTPDTQDKVATHFFSSDQSYRYWRLSIVDPDNANAYLEIPKLILANATVLTQNPDKTFGYTLSDQSEIRRTDYGHQYSDQRPNLRSMDFSFKYIDYTDSETLMDIYNTVQSVIPIAISLDSTEVLFDKDRFFIYGTLDKSMSFKGVVRNIFDSALKINEVI